MIKPHDPGHDALLERNAQLAQRLGRMLFLYHAACRHAGPAFRCLDPECRKTEAVIERAETKQNHTI